MKPLNNHFQSLRSFYAFHGFEDTTARNSFRMLQPSPKLIAVLVFRVRWSLRASYLPNFGSSREPELPNARKWSPPKGCSSPGGAYCGPRHFDGTLSRLIDICLLPIKQREQIGLRAKNNSSMLRIFAQNLRQPLIASCFGSLFVATRITSSRLSRASKFALGEANTASPRRPFSLRYVLKSCMASITGIPSLCRLARSEGLVAKMALVFVFALLRKKSSNFLSGNEKENVLVWTWGEKPSIHMLMQHGARQDIVSRSSTTLKADRI